MMSWLDQKILGFFVKTNGVFSRPILNGWAHIFMLHRVLPENLRSIYKINRDLAITPEFLEDFIITLKKRGYLFISLDELHELLRTEKKPNKKFICITLDDGYRDNMEYAYPILKKHRVPFAIYITTCFPNHTAHLWWYWLEEKVYEKDTLVFENTHYNTESETEKLLAYQQIRTVIKSSSLKQRDLFVETFFKRDKISIFEEVANIALSWEELKQICSDPLVTIGAHTENHLSLASLNETDMINEITASKNELETKLSIPISHFAYPYGGIADAGQREYIAAEKAGFKTSVLNYPGNIFSAHKNYPMTMPRYALSNSMTKERLESYLNGIYHYSNQSFRKTIKYPH